MAEALAGEEEEGVARAARADGSGGRRNSAS
jgi:hypothetical protein